MAVKIGEFRPTTQERVSKLREKKGNRVDPGMIELLDALESGDPVEVPVDAQQHPKGLRIAISRAANKRGLSVETFEDVDDAGNPVVVVVKADQPQPRSAPRTVEQSGSGKRRGRPRKQSQSEMALEDQATAIREDKGELATEQDEASL